MKKDKLHIYTDEATFEMYAKKQTSILDYWDTLEGFASFSLGEAPGDRIEYFENPTSYLVEKYFELYGKYHPPISDHTTVLLASNKIDLNAVAGVKNNIKKLMQEMGEHSPTITKKGLKLNLKEESFKKYLNPNKVDEYEALKTFVDASNLLMDKYNASGSVNLLRFANGLKFNGSRITIDSYKFI